MYKHMEMITINDINEEALNGWKVVNTTRTYVTETGVEPQFDVLMYQDPDRVITK